MKIWTSTVKEKTTMKEKEWRKKGIILEPNIRTIESDESISGNLKLALVSMAKMSNETQKSVQNICEG